MDIKLIKYITGIRNFILASTRMEVKYVLNMDEFRQRAKDLGMENLKIIYGFIKVISLTTATIVLLRILYHIETPLENTKPEVYLSLILLSVSFIKLLVTYDGAIFGTLFLFKIPTKWVTIFPFSFVPCEFLSFAILSPEFFFPGEKIENSLLMAVGSINLWFVINFIYHILISAFCWKARKLIHSSIGFLTDTKLRSIFKKYGEYMTKEFIGSGVVGLISIVCFITIMSLETVPYMTYVYGLDLLAIKFRAAFFFLIALSAAYQLQHLKRKDIGQYI